MIYKQDVYQKKTLLMSRVKTISLAIAGMAAFASPIAAQDAQTPDTDVWYRLVTM